MAETTEAGARRHGRLPWFRPDELDEEQRAYYDQLMATPRDKSHFVDPAGRLEGAFNARLLDPPVGTAIQEVGSALRFCSKLSARQREIVILSVAAHERSDFEWHGHAPVAAKAGLSDEELECIRTRTPAPTLPEADRVAREVAEELLATRDLSDETFAEAEAVLGLPQLFDVVSLVGHYQHTAMSMRVWRVPLRRGDTPVFPTTAD